MEIGRDRLIETAEVGSEPFRQLLEEGEPSRFVQRLPARQDIAREGDTGRLATAGEQSLASIGQIALRQTAVPAHAAEQLPAAVRDRQQEIGKERTAVHERDPIATTDGQIT